VRISLRLQLNRENAHSSPKDESPNNGQKPMKGNLMAKKTKNTKNRKKKKKKKKKARLGGRRGGLKMCSVAALWNKAGFGTAQFSRRKSVLKKKRGQR